MIRTIYRAVAILPIVTGCQDSDLNRQVFDAVWTGVHRYYYDENFHGVDWQKTRRDFRPRAIAAGDTEDLYGILNQMIALLDDAHTRLVPPADPTAEDFRLVSDKRLQTLWVKRESRPYVRFVPPGSLHARNGVEIGWTVEGVCGIPVTEFDWPRCPFPHATMQLKDRSGADHCIHSNAVLLRHPSVHSHMLTGNTAYIYIGNFFGEQSYEDLEAAVERFWDAEWLIVDLRYNRGGTAIDMLDALRLLVEEGTRIGKLTPRHEAAHWMKVRGRSLLRRSMGFFAGSIIVLADNSTRSSAEIFAEALRDVRHACIIGRRTRGEVLPADDVPLPDGGVLWVSIFDFVTAAGKRLEGHGVEPDVHLPYDDGYKRLLREGRDPFLVRALQEATSCRDDHGG